MLAPASPGGSHVSDRLHRQMGQGQPYQACPAIADSDTVALCVHRPLSEAVQAMQRPHLGGALLPRGRACACRNTKGKTQKEDVGGGVVT